MTPGPWKFCEAGDCEYSALVGGKNRVCVIDTIVDRSECGSMEILDPTDKRAIEAVPELLTALIQCAHAMVKYEALLNSEADLHLQPPSPALQEAQAAISKATGQPFPIE